MKNPNRLKNKLTKKRNFITSDFIICACICVFSFFALKTFMDKSNKDFTSVYTPPENTTHQIHRVGQVVEADFSKKKRQKDNMEISGYLEAGEPLSFIIDDYYAKIEYELDFGNGKSKKIEKNLTKFTYPRAGTYHVKLWGTFNGEKKLLHKERIKIQKGIEVAPDAYVENND